ncbi:MAG: DUF5121 domain-containing protein [Prevotella sp.]|nr:DUF5121 domain-containing protein [Prevotella sp.]
MKQHLLRQAMLAVTLLATTASFASTVITPGTSVQNLKQGETYTFADADGYYVNSSFFTKNADGTYTCNVIDGTYTVTADATLKALTVTPVTANGTAATMSEDGTGAVYILGTGIGLPTSSNQPGWTPGKGIAMAPTGDLTYEITGIVGQEFGTTVNFKFFGQNNWGIEFKGSAGADYAITSTKGSLGVGTGSDGHDNGNLFINTGAEWAVGDTVTITLDLSMGVQAGTLTTTVKKSAVVFNPTVNGNSFMNTTYGYVYPAYLTQGEKLTFAGADAFASDSWYMDPDFFEKDGDSYKFLPVDGVYAILADFTLNYFKVMQVDPTTYMPVQYDTNNGGGNIWVIGSKGIGKPSYASNGHNWYTGYQNDIPLGHISNTLYRMTLNVGEQLNLKDINFKFFGQPDWSPVEFSKAKAPTLTGTLAPYFKVSSDGNVNLAINVDSLSTEQKAMLSFVKSVVFTLDTTKPAAPVLSVEAILTDGTTTGVKAINAVKPVKADDAWYTIDGRQCSRKPAQPGLYIHQGRKVVVK